MIFLLKELIINRTSPLVSTGGCEAALWSLSSFFENDILKSITSNPLNTIVYIDGFNLYYSLKYTPYKWLNIERLVHSVLDPSWHNVVQIKYFTARVKRKPKDPSNVIRQDMYLRAIQTIQKVEIIYGKFKRRNIKASMVIKNPEQLKQVKRIIGKNISPFSKYEEKETDVNIATHIIYDCCNENISSIVLLSNDTDLKLPLWFARKKLKKRVIVITPTKNTTRSIVSLEAHQDLQKISNKTINLTEEHLKNSQFSDVVSGISKPKSWS